MGIKAKPGKLDMCHSQQMEISRYGLFGVNGTTCGFIFRLFSFSVAKFN